MIRALSITLAALAGGLLSASPAGAVTFQSPTPSPATSNASPSPIDLSPADLDQDGLTDLVVADEGQAKLGRLMSNGNGTFTLYESALASAANAAPATGRLNADSFPDAIFNAFSAGKVQIAINDGTGGFNPLADVAVDSPGTAQLGDLNGDGLDDLLVSINENLNYALNQGTGTFGTLVPLTS